MGGAKLGIQVVPTGGGVGAEVRGVDLRHIDDALFAAIHRAWIAHGMLLFRAQSLSDAALVAFSRRLGGLDLAPVQETGRRFAEGFPEIYVVSNVLKDGVPIGSLGAGEAVWHTDMSYLPAPPKASLLYALEIPPAGGDTSFCSMYGALERLPAALRVRMAGLRLKHDGTYNSGGYVRLGVIETDDPRQSPGAVHPVICRHPESGRDFLYLGRRRNAYLVGLDLAESEALLDALWAGIDEPAIGYRHRWAVGDLVLWDNRCTMHRRDSFDPSARRVMHRTQVQGAAPPAAPV
jgi:taurine dioxygenase